MKKALAFVLLMLSAIVTPVVRGQQTAPQRFKASTRGPTSPRSEAGQCLQCPPQKRVAMAQRLLLLSPVLGFS